MGDLFNNIFRPDVLVFLIPLAGIGIGAFSMWLKHQERMEKIRQGIDPDKRH